MVRFTETGDEAGDGLAPVTPLFGDRGVRAYPKTADEVRRTLLERTAPGEDDGSPVSAVDRNRSTSAGQRGASRAPAAEWRTEWDDDPVPSAPAVDDAPIDLFAARADRSGRREGERSSARAGAEVDPSEAAERGLLKKLAARQLSVSEARTFLGRHELGAEAVDAIVGEFLTSGYLDDARLAEQIVYAGADRKGQGRQVIAQNLARRGVPRDVADAALAELPDDDAERALEFARSKATSMRGLERDVALRRLAGQLARRGYGGSVALDAARRALSETVAPPGRVRFEEL